MKQRFFHPLFVSDIIVPLKLKTNEQVRLFYNLGAAGVRLVQKQIVRVE